MRLRIGHGLAAVLTWAVGCGPLAAQQAADLPSVTTLNCGKDCQSATDPKPIGVHSVVFPGFLPENYPSEGMVLMYATISKDGTLKDMKVVRVIGPQVFADNALEAVKDWRYQPATRNGTPVDRSNWEIEARFTYQENLTGARDAVFRKVRKAIGLSNESKYSESIALLLPILSMPHLTFYEREVASLQLAINYFNLGDIATANEYLDDIAVLGDRYLSKSLRPVFWRMAAIANASTGQFLEAKESFDKLNALQPVASDDPLRKVMQNVDEQLGGGKAVVAAVRIPKSGVMPSWRHKVLRPNFSILDVKGKLDRLRITCGEHLTETTYGDQAEWHIPKNWNKCELVIYGDPGTTFTLSQMAD